MELLQYLFNGAVASGIYMLVAVGITLVFGLTKLINFAHGQFMVVSIFVAVGLISGGAPFIVAAAASIVAAAIMGYLSQRFLFRFTLDNPNNGLIVGLGLMLILEAASFKIWGGFKISVPAPIDGGVALGGVYISWTRLLVLAVAVLITAALFLVLGRTRIGTQMRAANENPVAAAHVGVNVTKIIGIAFVAGSALAGLGGVFYATLQPVGAYDGSHLILQGFAVALLGGLGNVSGLAKASVIYGMGESLVAGYLQPEYVPYFTYGIIVFVLLLRPGGLFSKNAPGDSTFARSGRRTLSKYRFGRIEKIVGAALFVVLPIVLFDVLGTSKMQALLVLTVLIAIQVYALAYVYETAGILSLAQGALMAIGAYSAGVIAVHNGLGFWWALVIGILMCALAGAILGLIVARARGHYLLLVTLAFSALVTQLTLTAIPLTNGDNGLIMTEQLPFGIRNLRSQFYLVFGVMLVIALGLWLLKTTRFGKQLSAVRENDVLAKSLGLRVGLTKIGAFALSGALAGIGGILYVYIQQIIVPTAFDPIFSINVVIILVLGGVSVAGPLAGSLIFYLLPQALNLKPADQQLMFGVILVLIILLMPRGLMPAVTDAYAWLRNKITRHPTDSAHAPRGEVQLSVPASRATNAKVHNP